MNREIKFRAWDNDNKEMLEVEIGMDGYIRRWNEEEGHMEMFGALHDDRLLKQCSVMQYVGLRDINGNEIYEGDLINFNNNPSIYEVKFGNYWNGKSFEDAVAGYGYYAERIDNNNWYECWIKDFYSSEGDELDMKVIGNIYQNPELLEKLNNE